MMTLYFLLLFWCLLCFINQTGCSATNKSAVLISRYSKVAHWGQAAPVDSKNEGRSSTGQTLWTHRSDANVVSGQNLKPNIVYHYAVPSRRVQKYDDDRSDNQLAVGEAQERFNAKPYFNYGSPSPKQQNQQNNNISPPTSSFFDSPSPDVRPTFTMRPPSDSYNSPFSSYNPPAVTVDGSKDDGPVYPPIDQATPSGFKSNVVRPSKETSIGYSYTPPPKGYGLDYDAPKKTKEVQNPQPQPDAPPDDSQKNYGSDHLFYPPNDMKQQEVILDHPPPGYEDADSPDSGHMGNHDNTMMAPPDMAEGDLNPPPSDDFSPFLQNGGSPEQAHGFGDYDLDHHHVYPVIEHTTTPAPPHDERVNKGHYSYYYLGRKLWYIPLYFSVYFIIYVTILILKSIARHKINFKHELYDKLHRGGRVLVSEESIDNMHKNVTSGINNMNRKYMMM